MNAWILVSHGTFIIYLNPVYCDDRYNISEWELTENIKKCSYDIIYLEFYITNVNFL